MCQADYLATSPDVVGLDLTSTHSGVLEHPAYTDNPGDAHHIRR